MKNAPGAKPRARASASAIITTWKEARILIRGLPNVDTRPTARLRQRTLPTPPSDHAPKPARPPAPSHILAVTSIIPPASAAQHARGEAARAQRPDGATAGQAGQRGR